MEMSNKSMVLKKASFSHLPGNIQLPWPAKQIPHKGVENQKIRLIHGKHRTADKRTNNVEPFCPRESRRYQETMYAYIVEACMQGCRKMHSHSEERQSWPGKNFSNLFGVAGHYEIHRGSKFPKGKSYFQLGNANYLALSFLIPIT